MFYVVSVVLFDCVAVSLLQAIMAAFVISGYSSTYYRAGSKPFNPLLGETYECIREDKGMCFIAEQVGTRNTFITVLRGPDVSSVSVVDLGSVFPFT